MRFAMGVTAAVYVSRLALAHGAAAVARCEAQGLSPWLLRVWLFTVTPSVPTSKYVLDAFVCFELAGLCGPVCSEGTPVHVLEFAGFTRFARQGGRNCGN
jgi:hypothetical protein